MKVVCICAFNIHDAQRCSYYNENFKVGKSYSIDNRFKDEFQLINLLNDYGDSFSFNIKDYMMYPSFKKHFEYEVKYKLDLLLK